MLWRAPGLRSLLPLGLLGNLACLDWGGHDACRSLPLGRRPDPRSKSQPGEWFAVDGSCIASYSHYALWRRRRFRIPVEFTNLRRSNLSM